MAIAKSLTLLMKLKTDDFQSGIKGAERQADRSARNIERSGKKLKILAGCRNRGQVP